MQEHFGFSAGLTDVVVDATSISEVNGKLGQLFYRGYSIDELYQHSNFEECAYLILYGNLPTTREYGAFLEKLKLYRTLQAYTHFLIESAPKNASPMVMLQTAVSSLGNFESEPKLNTPLEIDAAIRVIGTFPAIVAQISRQRRNLKSIPPREDLDHVSNFLYMLNGVIPSEKISEMCNKGLMLHIDHDFNASTFTSRVVSSTEARLTSSIASAIGAFSGLLHGGASEKTTDMLEKASQSNNIEQWVQNMLDSKRKIMGFGHRIYKTTDPRAKILRKMLEELLPDTSEEFQKKYQLQSKLHDILIHEFSKRGKKIFPNADFWSGTILNAFGIEAEDVPLTGTLTRVVGWCAHILEAQKNKKIYRPLAKYVGEYNKPYVRMADR